MNMLRNRIALIKKGGDRGDQALSYLGVVVLVALIAVAVIKLNLDTKISGAIDGKVDNVISEGNKGGAGGGTPTDPAKKPVATPK